jgi:hypothetical protein
MDCKDNPKLLGYIQMIIKNISRDEDISYQFEKNPDYETLISFKAPYPKQDKPENRPKFRNHAVNHGDSDYFSKQNNEYYSQFERTQESEEEDDRQSKDYKTVETKPEKRRPKIDIRDDYGDQNNKRVNTEVKEKPSPKGQGPDSTRNKKRNVSVGRERKEQQGYMTDINTSYDPLRVDPSYKNKLKTNTKLQLPAMPTQRPNKQGYK